MNRFTVWEPSQSGDTHEYFSGNSLVKAISVARQETSRKKKDNVGGAVFISDDYFVDEDNAGYVQWQDFSDDVDGFALDVEFYYLINGITSYSTKA